MAMAALSEGKDDNFVVVLENQNKPPYFIGEVRFWKIRTHSMIKNKPHNLSFITLWSNSPASLNGSVFTKNKSLVR